VPIKKIQSGWLVMPSFSQPKQSVENRERGVECNWNQK
jgi:hypothetical protein